MAVRAELYSSKVDRGRSPGPRERILEQLTAKKTSLLAFEDEFQHEAETYAAALEQLVPLVHAELRRIVTEAANAVADKALTRGSSRAPLFVAIDFEGEASFAPEESPWLRFMQELLGHAWIRLVILGAPAGIRAELIESATVDGVHLFAVELADHQIDIADHLVVRRAANGAN